MATIMPDQAVKRLSAVLRENTKAATHSVKGAIKPGVATGPWLQISTASKPTGSQKQTGDALCEGKGGDRAAGGGHVAKRIARLFHPQP